MMARSTVVAAALAVALLACAAAPARAGGDKGGTCGKPYSIINPLTQSVEIVNANAKPTLVLRETVAQSSGSFSAAVLGATVTTTLNLFDEDNVQVGFGVLSGTVVNKPTETTSVVNQETTYIFFKAVGSGKHKFGPGRLVTLTTGFYTAAADTIVQPVVAGQGDGFCTEAGNGVVVFSQATSLVSFYL